MKKISALARAFNGDFRVFQKGNKLNLLFLPEICEKIPVDETLAFTAHIHYPDFLPLLIKSLDKWPRSIKIFLTTNDSNLAVECKEKFLEMGFDVKVVACENRGRNFAPLLVEFQNDLARFKYMLHVHSKKSVHSASRLGETWLNRSTNFLLDKERVARAIALMGCHPEIGIVFPFVSDLIRIHNFTWGSNLNAVLGSPLRKLLPEFMPDRRDLINFPAGGMFVAKVEPLLEMLHIQLRYGDFPPESGQLDGTLHHAIERLIGSLFFDHGYIPVVYDDGTDSFYHQSAI